MLDAQPQIWDGEGIRSLEVRWIFPGQLPQPMAGWFWRFPAQTVMLEDAYLLDPYLPGLSVKIRAGRALEIKAYRGSPGHLEVAGRACGRLESWHKWSFAYDRPAPGSGDPARWKMVRKRRRISRFSLADGLTRASVPGADLGPGCAVELTEFRTLGEVWWTLGFEAIGPADELRSQLETVSALVFAQALPDGTELGLDDSMSYAEWLRGPGQRR
jgi:hypothetical protein